MKREKILVIGACGQVGRDLVPRLTDMYGTENVVGCDIRNPETGGGEINFEQLDVLNREDFHAYVSKNNFTQIYHMAAILSAAGERAPEAAWKLNVEGLINVLDAATRYRIEKIYWPSSIAVFGPSTPRISTPQNTIMDPATVYGMSKQAGERWCAWYHHKYNIDVRSLRYPGLIGYRTKPGGGTTDYAVEIFFKALSEKKYECFLRPDTYLPMMYMDDAIRATVMLMDAPAEKIRVRSSYNISGVSFCPSEMAAEIRRHIPGFEMSYAPDFRQQIADSWPQSIDDTEAVTDWGWRPHFSLATMADEMMHQLMSVV